jgi:hypothetical protein
MIKTDGFGQPQMVTTENPIVMEADAFRAIATGTGELHHIVGALSFTSDLPPLDGENGLPQVMGRAVSVFEQPGGGDPIVKTHEVVAEAEPVRGVKGTIARALGRNPVRIMLWLNDPESEANLHANNS